MSNRSTQSHPRFWRSRAGIVLLIFLGIAGFLLLYEHRAHVFTGNGILIGLLAVCIGMHLFMHGGHGGHGGGHRHERSQDEEKE
ncbi:DUF2933 domain-containing protein [Pyruvatibacter mobilis]|uniref:DUF2933 domain-containing protein n=1 Tax=Pyruvatibacter mobilis TaxID=1712261 RepID=UPI003BA8F8DC